MKRCQDKDLNTAAWYDAFHFSERGFRESNPCDDVKFLLPLLTQGRQKVLDIGCGRGLYFPFFKAAEIHAVDISPLAIAHVKEKYPNSFPVVVNVVKEGLPYAENTFDAVYCGELVEHAPDPHFIVAEIRRVLAAGGVCILNTPYKEMIPCDVHLWFLDRNDLVSMFAGFAAVSIFRFDNSPSRDNWEHFLVVATK